ncbi:PA14 domain-containing protein [Deinococcus aquaedulcis]|uniref:PA14 domain-containing protein n=1 Tax=Deinococcus aquaedulcis TaxID=2840455 RepID=UPI001C839770|nr:PA14 domain-containing protein [Deinococcus aquaedulcis]
MFGMKLPQWRTALLGLLGASSLVACGQNTPSPAPSPAPGAEVAVEDDLNSQATTTSGLTGVYYNNADFTGTTVTRVDTTISKSWGTGRPVTGIDPTTYSVRWQGQVTPAYSETYSFFLTSSGSARLSINGQPLVNDWANHASKTSAATITLLAGVKYDIRLEMARSSTTPGAVRLEWQSSRQQREVVPQGRLFPTGSQTQAAINALQAEPKFKELGLTLDPLQTRTTVGAQGLTRIVSILPQQGFVYASLRNGTIGGILYFSRAGDTNTLLSVLDGQKLVLGALNQYYAADGTQTEAQRLLFQRRLAAFLSNGFYKEESVSAQQLAPMGIGAKLICEEEALSSINVQLQPPPDCAGQVCELAAKDYRDSVCDEIGIVEDTVWTVVFLPAGAFSWSVTILNGVPTEFHTSAWAKYRECLVKHGNPVEQGSSGEREGCVVGIKVTAKDPQRRVQVNTSGMVEVTVANVSSDPQWPANATLDATVNFTSVSANVSTIFNRTNFKILPNGTNGFSVGYMCPAVPTTLYAEIGFLHNANRPISDRASIKIECTGAEPKLQATDPPPISAPVGQTATGSFEISNVGDPGTVLNYTLTPSGGLSVSSTNGALEQGRTSSITVSAPCTTVGKANASLLIQSNDPDKPQHTIPVAIECLSENWIGHITFSFNTGYSRAADNYEEGLCEANAYAWYRNDGNPYSQLGMQNLTFRGMEKIIWSDQWWSVNCDQYGHQALNSKDGLYTAKLNELIASWKENNDPSIDDSKVIFRSTPYTIQEPRFPGNGTSSGALGWNIYASY